jgi:signal transduction histidine kinase/ActR/RegA family two-component response regulator
MAEGARPRGLRPHRLTVLVLVFAALGTVFGAVLTRGVVHSSEKRLLEQKAGAAAIVMSSMMSQTTAATGALAATVTPQGTVNEPAFQGTSAALEQTGTPDAMGARATAIVNLTSGKVAASTGQLLLDVTDPKQRAALVHAAGVAAATPGHSAVVGMARADGVRALTLLSSAPGGTAAYLELPIESSVSTEKLPPLFDRAFGGLDFAVYVGAAAPQNLLFTNRVDGKLDGDVAESFGGVAATTGYEAATYDADTRPLRIQMAARSPLTGSFAHRLPWMLVGLGLLSSVAVLGLVETVQRRRDQALGLVAEVESRNVEIQEAVERRRQAEERLAQSQRLEAVGQLAGGIAHDFNNLLAVIFSYVGFLKTESAGKAWAEDVEEIDRAAHRAAELTQQLLMFSRRETSRPSVVDARALVADRFGLLQRTLGEDLVVTLELPDHPVPVRADPVELDQVVMNLVVNARDAMPDGGALTLAIRESTTAAGAAEVNLVVSDTGVGMDAEVLQHAFEPFFTTMEVGRGTGLGLATVYGIATRWGGTVSLDSTPGVGTTVTVSLTPSDEALTAVPAPVEESARTHQGTVLLVEDDPSVRKVAERILCEAGFSVVTAANGPDALERFAEQPVDVLVSDVVMPGGLSGPELAERLRLERPSLPVVLATGHSRDHLTRRGPLPEGAQVVRKPFENQVLVEAVQRGVSETAART